MVLSVCSSWSMPFVFSAASRSVSRDFKHIINGTEVVIRRTYPPLSENAVPTASPNLPKYISRTLPRERKRRNVSQAPTPCKRSRTCVDTGAKCPLTDIEAAIIQSHGVPKPVAEELFIFKFKRPSELWSLQMFKQSNIACYQTAEFAQNETPPVVLTKMVVFVIGAGLPSCRIFVGGWLHKPTDVESKEQAEEALSYADSLAMCSGISPSKKFEELHVNIVARLTVHHLFSAPCNGANSASCFRIDKIVSSLWHVHTWKA